MVAPAFYDDFSDGKFQNRTGTDPWGRPLPEWTPVGEALASEWDASSGALVRTTVNPTKNEHFLEASFHAQGNEYFKLSYDRFCWLGDSQGGSDLRMNTRIYTETGDYFEEIRRDDGHVYFTLLKGGGYKVGLAGISFAPQEPYATGASMPIPDEKWVHVEIIRQPDHKVFIFDDGSPPYGAWGDSSYNQVGLEYEQTHSANYELWDNPHLYHASVGGNPGHDGSNFPDVTIEGKFVKIRVGAETGYEFNNIKFEAYGGTTTGTISGTVTDGIVPIQGVSISSDGYLSTTDASGGYTITDVPVGTYTVSASKEGYQDSSQSGVVVNEGEATTVDFVLEDNVSPYTSDHNPAKGAVGVDNDTNIVVQVKDDGAGVDLASIVMTVEGVQVIPTVSGTSAEYTLTYDPPTTFDYDQVVDITIDAKDLAGNIMPQDSYSFTVQSTLDTTPPATVANLATSNPSANSIALAWTAPGDDGNVGTASEYDIRYSLTQITETNWDSATQCIGEPSPQVAGSTETFTVIGLSSETTYYFALKAADEVPNWSDLSNCANGTTTRSVGPVPMWTDEFIDKNTRWDWSYEEGTGYKQLTTIDDVSVVEIGITNQSSSSSYSDCSLHEKGCQHNEGVFEATLRYAGDHKFGTMGWGVWNYDNIESAEAAWFWAASPEAGASLSNFQAMIATNSTITYQEPLPAIDIEQWHTYRVEFFPAGISFFVDGQEVASTSQHLSKAQRFVLWIDNYLIGMVEGKLIPVGYLDMQQDQRMYIDWVKYYDEYVAPVLTPITFDTTPKGASVSLNGTSIGVT